MWTWDSSSETTKAGSEVAPAWERHKASLPIWKTRRRLGSSGSTTHSIIKSMSQPAQGRVSGTQDPAGERRIREESAILDPCQGTGVVIHRLE